MIRILNMNTEKKVAVIAITKKGCILGRLISLQLKADFFVPEKFFPEFGDKSFDSLKEVFAHCFSYYEGVVAVMAQGIVSRMIDGLLKDKFSDPAVVVCDEVGRFAISMLSGHEGGANELTFLVSSITGAEPVITTASEANKIYVAGVGCRKGVSKEKVIDSIKEAAKLANINLSDLRVIASCWYKINEEGLLEAAEELGCYIRFLPKHLYENDLYNFKESSANKYLGIKGVAEPSALLSARNPELVLRKTIFDKVTVAIVKERLING
ncbi:cobalamin biosynthesis protein [Deferribacter abyssi]|uniref:cobalamin biosynthesis protein n=1 Tax=Deferribacter abyssi TaxID=213806 RepID=UPI003C27A5AC